MASTSATVSSSPITSTSTCTTASVASLGIHPYQSPILPCGHRTGEDFTNSLPFTAQRPLQLSRTLQRYKQPLPSKVCDFNVYANMEVTGEEGLREKMGGETKKEAKRGTLELSLPVGLSFMRRGGSWIKRKSVKQGNVGGRASQLYSFPSTLLLSSSARATDPTALSPSPPSYPQSPSPMPHSTRPISFLSGCSSSSSSSSSPHTIPNLNVHFASSVAPPTAAEGPLSMPETATSDSPPRRMTSPLPMTDEEIRERAEELVGRDRGISGLGLEDRKPRSK